MRWVGFRRRPKFDLATHECKALRQRGEYNLWDCQTPGCGRVFIRTRLGLASAPQSGNRPRGLAS